MKYSEFEKRITERLGFRVKLYPENIIVYAHGKTASIVSLYERYQMDIRPQGLTDDEARYLAQMCHELACTTLEAREDEKKYRLKIPGIKINPYIQKRYACNDFYLGNGLNDTTRQAIFTKQEIGRFPVALKDLLDICEWEVVE